MNHLQKSFPAIMVTVLVLHITSLNSAQPQRISQPIPGASYTICTESQPVKGWFNKLGLTAPESTTTLLTTTFYTFDGNLLKQVVEKKEEHYNPDAPKTICETKDSYIDPTAPKPRPPWYRLREAGFNTGSIRFVIKFYDKNGNVIDDYRIFSWEVENAVKALNETYNLQLHQERGYLPLADFKKYFFRLYAALVRSNQNNFKEFDLSIQNKFKEFDLSIAQEDTRYRQEDVKNLGDFLYFAGFVSGTVLLLSPFFVVAGIVTGIEYIYNKLKAPFTKPKVAAPKEV